MSTIVLHLPSSFAFLIRVVLLSLQPATVLFCPTCSSIDLSINSVSFAFRHSISFVQVDQTSFALTQKSTLLIAQHGIWTYIYSNQARSVYRRSIFRCKTSDSILCFLSSANPLRTAQHGARLPRLQRMPIWLSTS